MDPEYSLHDVARCHLCESPGPQLHCIICKEYLCKYCKEKHLSDEFKEHKAVPLKFISKCKKHSLKICYLFCERCNVPLCGECVSSGKHNDHDFANVVEKLENKKCVLKKDLKELKKSIYPKYCEIVSGIPIQKADLNKNFQKLITVINKHGEEMRREIDNAMKELKADLFEMNSRHLTALDWQEDKIKHSVSEITHFISDLNKLLKTNKMNKICAYKSRNSEFKRYPTKLQLSLPSFTPQKINKEQIYQQFGFLPALSIKPLIDKPQIIASINTEYRGLKNVSCPSDEQIWTCGFNDIVMRLYNLQGEVVKSIQTKTLQGPRHMSVTRNGDLVYTDEDARTVNIVKNTQIHFRVKVIRLRRWRPLYVCSTSFGDFLVLMDSDDERQTKIVRYSGFKEKQSIQYNPMGHPFYVSGFSPKFICENRNLDICVADLRAGALVVVSQAGHIRFTYTGPSSKARKTFSPIGITTDSQSRILTTDCYNNCIHILNYDGQFLCYIDNCYLQDPRGLCVDTRDNLFVAERSGRVKKNQILQIIKLCELY